MTRRSFAAGPIVLCAALGVSGLLQAQSRELRERVAYVSAVDQSGAPVPSLSPDDVVIREDKVAREVLSVLPATEPMEITLLVDNSQAAEPHVRDLREGIAALLAAGRRAVHAGACILHMHGTARGRVPARSILSRRRPLLLRRDDLRVADGVAVEEDAALRHLDVVEDRHRVHLVEP